MAASAPDVPDPERALDRVVAALATVPGVSALALGGSRARGTATETSDIDVGLYYRRDTRPDFDDLLRIARELDDRHSPDGHGNYGEWGPWINGGVWLHVDGFKVDILLRDADRVRDVLTRARQGNVDVDYQAGHPHAFTSGIYAGEVVHNVPLVDSDATLASLRALVDPYPPAMRRELLRAFGWEASFALDTAAGAASRGDVAYLAGCAYRAVACLCQVLFALNERFLVNEKGAVAAADRFPRCPPRFAARIADSLTMLAADPAQLTAVLAALRRLHAEVHGLVGAEPPAP